MSISEIDKDKLNKLAQTASSAQDDVIEFISTLSTDDDSTVSGGSSGTVAGGTATGSTGGTDTTTGGSTGPVTQPGTPAASKIDLSKWNIALDFDTKGGNGTPAYQISGYNGDLAKAFAGTYQPKAPITIDMIKRGMWTNPDESLTFRAACNGGRTSNNTKYARRELRETMPDGSLAGWKIAQGVTITGKLRVDELPTAVGGALAHQVFCQIHGVDNELIRFYYEKGGILSFHNDQSGSDNKEHIFTLADAKGNKSAIPLGADYSFEVVAKGALLTATAEYNGVTYSASCPINDIWKNDTLYVKGGVYLGNADNSLVKNGTGFGQVTYSELDYTH